MTVRKKQVSRDQRSVTKADVAIGLKIRTARMVSKMSQAELGDKIGVSFQQIQKYEKGVNRVSGSRLMQLAVALHVPTAELLAESKFAPNSEGERIARFVASREGHQIILATMNLPSHVQQSIIDLARTLAKEAA